MLCSRMSSQVAQVHSRELRKRPLDLGRESPALLNIIQNSAQKMPQGYFLMLINLKIQKTDYCPV